jgi:phage terminase large subunit
VISVIWPKWSKIINEKFVLLTKCVDRYVILYGSRGSSKSDYVAKQLVLNCLTHKYFKCILYRKTYNTIQESSYENIKQTIISLGLERLFKFNINPLSIRCVNGNRFIARGGDEPGKIKSLKDPTCVWYEEDVPEEGDFATISLSIRSSKADTLQEYFTINPEIQGAYTENWFWKRFFKDHNELTYRTTTTIEVEGRPVEYSVMVHHSTYQDNKWLPDAVKAQIEAYKFTNPYLYSVFALGLWTMKETGGNFYKSFKRAINTTSTQYKRNLPLHISFDFNVNPYITLTIWQIEGDHATQVDEICLPTPNNKTEKLCAEFKHKYRSHQSGLFIYGDPSGIAEDTRLETGYNDFTLIQGALKDFKPSMRIFKAAPPVVMRGNWINDVFNNNEGGLTFSIGNNCVNSIADYMYLKEASDGTKAKIKEKNKETGVTFERYGHTSDANDYLLCFAFNGHFTRYQSGGAPRRYDVGNDREYKFNR